MIKKYNEYIKESVGYRYPFERIFIKINGVDDYYKVYKFIEDNFHFKLNPIREYDTLKDIPLIHVMLNVEEIYDMRYRGLRRIDETDILRFYSNEYDNYDILFDEIFVNNFSNYINKNDILEIYELSSINSLLSNGSKDVFKHMYLKPKKNVYESLLNKLEGPSFEDVKEYYEKGFKSGKVDLRKYLEYCNDNNLEIPTMKEIEKSYPSVYPQELLHTSIIANNKKGVNLALENKADINFLAIPLFYAIFNNRYDMMKYLIELGADVNGHNGDPLVHAAKFNRFKFVKYLLKKGANPNLNKQAILYAEQNDDKRIINLLNEYKDKLQESLLNKLDGPNEEEIKNKFLSGEINIVKYIEFCKENNLKEPSSEELLSILSNKTPEEIISTSIKIDFFDGIKYVLNNKNIKIHLLTFSLFKRLLILLNEYNEKELLFDVIDKYFIYSNTEHKLDLESYYLLSCTYGYIDGIIDALSNRGVEVDARSYLAIELAVKYNRLDVIKFLLNYTKGTDVYNIFISVANEYLITHNIDNKEIKNYLYNLK